MEIISYINRLYSRIILTAAFFMMAAIGSSAQKNFISQLQDTVRGQGIVVVNHDARLDSIVNGYVELPEYSEHRRVERTADYHKTTQSKVNDNLPAYQKITNATVREKARGYRIQVYFGGNQRTDQSKAQQIGTKIQSRFPELKAYTTFESPHWRCRVGDFKTREDAAPYVRRLRSTGFCPDAAIVRSEIYIYE